MLFRSGTYANHTFSSWAEISEYKKVLEEIDEYDEFVYTPSLVLQVPRIIRVLTFDKVPVYNIKLNRKNIYTRDNNMCQYCGKSFDTSELNIDHVIPKAQGGTNDWNNLVCSCIKCNQRKRDRTPKQANMSLIRKPFKPNYSPSIKIHIGHKKYKDWSHFVSEDRKSTRLNSSHYS